MSDGTIPDSIVFLFLVHMYTIFFELFCKKRPIKAKFKRREKTGEGAMEWKWTKESEEGNKQSSLGKMPWSL